MTQEVVGKVLRSSLTAGRCFCYMWLYEHFTNTSKRGDGMDQHAGPEKPKSGANKWLIGCLGAVVVLAALVIVAGYLAYSRGRAFIADQVNQGVVQEINSSNLPQDQKREMVGQINQLTEGFKSGEVGFEEVGRVMEELVRSPLFATSPLWGVRSAYIDSSALSEEAKADARLQLSRFMYGVYEEEIPMHAVSTVIEPISEPIPNNPSELRLRPPAEVTEEQLRQFIANLEARADEAGVPDQRFEIDYAAELRRVIERAMNQPAGAPATPPDSSAPPAPPQPGGGQ